MAAGNDITACVSTVLDAGYPSGDAYEWTKVSDPSTVLGTSQTLTATTSGEYVVAVTAFNKTQTDTVMVTIDNPAQAAFSYSVFSDLKTVTFTNYSTNASNGYEWNFGDNNTSTAASPSHTYADFGNYTVTLTAKAPCGDDTESMSIAEVTALTIDAQLSQQMRVYPNPNDGNFVLDVKGVSFNKGTLQVMDITGRILWKKTVKTLNEQAIQLKNIESGIYFIRLEVDGKVGIQKIQVQ